MAHSRRDGTGKTRAFHRASSTQWVIWTRSANSHTGQRRQGASQAGQMAASDQATRTSQIQLALKGASTDGKRTFRFAEHRAHNSTFRWPHLEDGFVTRGPPAPARTHHRSTRTHTRGNMVGTGADGTRSSRRPTPAQANASRPWAPLGAKVAAPQLRPHPIRCRRGKISAVPRARHGESPPPAEGEEAQPKAQQHPCDGDRSRRQA